MEIVRWTLPPGAECAAPDCLRSRADLTLCVR